MSYRYPRNADRFSNYREITARRADTGACGHAIKPDDVIGWHSARKIARCAECWRKWAAENADADAYERSIEPYGFGGDY